MYIEKYTAHINDTLTKKTFKIIIDEDFVQSAHKKIFNKLSNFQDIVKITNFNNETVYSIDSGFINN